MFRMGGPPRPECLLKLLRRRFHRCDGPGEEPLTLKEACEEYTVLARQSEESKARTKAQGLTWRCHLCTYSYPAKGYGVRGGEEQNS